MITDLFNTNLWAQAWNEDLTTSVNKMKQAGIDRTRSFDNRADSFNKQVFSEEGRQRARRITQWLTGQGVAFKDNTILDIGAASGGFTVPFAEEGGRVTAVEPNLPLAKLLKKNTKDITNGNVEVVVEDFEEIDVAERGWEQAFDLVFVSMCPVIADWDSVEKVLSCARRFCYISSVAGAREHSLLNEVWPLLTERVREPEMSEMFYLTNLLYLKGYSFQSLVTREMKTAVLTRDAALKEVMDMVRLYQLPADEQAKRIIADYLEQTYVDDKVAVHQGGRFGKVLIQLEDQKMYGGER
ncbi:class I SAM-dependent methyltransferase [Paenibacillus donghaensis]|uniref:SAM-dependent methyltransferase n=1 Tax=Paenibacillus donghaensis TaxID=414771 RepID=A0A2Z2K4G6_9BACL|nr:methyltransferase domain-containing protein [Paenibacillus donghaensis]ASA20706.1 SAM-dependent methyltransferase [Paenibacillus donghaensis]